MTTSGTARRRRVDRSRWAAAGVLLLLVAAILGPAIAPRSVTAMQLERRLEAPSLAHPLGLDELGRDVLSRLLAGARVSVTVGLVVVGIAGTLGTLLGVAAGAAGGRWDAALMRAILTGGLYPQALYSAVVRRIRADREVRHVRAAVLKAHLNRQTRLGIDPLKEKLVMSLDPDRPEAAYHLGRLFAELEKTQEDALPGIGDTIKDRYFSAASATPASVFPRIIRLSQHHLGKLPKGSKVYHERRIQAICDRCDAFPSHLSLKDQGLFAIGYYHQRQDIFTKKTDLDTSATTDEE